MSARMNWAQFDSFDLAHIESGKGNTEEQDMSMQYERPACGI